MWHLFNISFQANVNENRLTLLDYLWHFSLDHRTNPIYQHYWPVMFHMCHALYFPLTSHSGQLSFVLKTLRLLAKGCCWLFTNCCYEAEACLDLLQTWFHSQIIEYSCLVSVSTFQMKMFHVLCQRHQVYTEKYTTTVEIKIEAFLLSTIFTMIRMKQVHVKNGSDLGLSQTIENNGMLMFVHESSGLNTGNRE